MAYSVDYIPPAVVARLRTSTSLAVFVRLDTDPALHLWFGVGDCPIGIDGIDEDGTVYQGGGRLGGLDALQVLINGKSEVVDFILSGIDPVAGGRMLDSIPPIKGKRLIVGITALDDFYQPMTSIIPMWTGIAAKTAEQMAPVTGTQAPKLSLALSVAAGDNARSRKAATEWSHLQQVEESRRLRAGTPDEGAPDDLFCRQTLRLSRGVQPSWPRYN